MSKEGINVCIRVRSLIQREIDAGETRGQDWVVDGDTNTIRSNTEGKKPMAFDRVFDDYATNIDVYDEAASHIIESALKGINGTILAYGQTSSGKTFTMTSIMQQAFAHIFQHVGTDTTRTYQVNASYAEVYNEVIIDLSNKNDKNLRIDENSGTITNLTRKSISSPDDLFDFLKAGACNRHVNKTNMNAESSRSHSIFQVMIESTPADMPTSTVKSGVPQQKAAGKLISVINFVDLAGSERAKSTGAEGNIFKEGVQINASLSALGKVIRALSAGGRHIPYRESKLTQLLRPSLGGNSRTTMICCVTPSRANIPETKSTLSFAFQAKSVVNTVGVNEILDDKQIIIRLKEKVVVLERRLSSLSDLVQQLKDQGVNVTDLELILTRQYIQQPSAGLQDPSKSVKRPRHTNSGFPSHNGNDLVSVPQSSSEPVKPLSIKSCGMQTDFSVLRKRKQMSSHEPSQLSTTAEDEAGKLEIKQEPNHLSDYQDAEKQTIIYANPSRVMSYLGVMTTGSNPSLAEFMDEDMDTLDNDLNQMLVTQGFTDHKKYEAEIARQQEEISRLNIRLTELTNTYEIAVETLQIKVDELSASKQTEVAALQAIIKEKECQLAEFTDLSSDKYYAMETQLARAAQELEHYKSHNELLNNQYNALVGDIKSTIDKEVNQYQQRERQLMTEINTLTEKLEETDSKTSQLELEYEQLLKEQEEQFQIQLTEVEERTDAEVRKMKEESDRSRKELLESNQDQLTRAYRQQNDLLNELEDAQKLLEDERMAFDEQLSRMKKDTKQQIAELKARIVQEEKRSLEYQSKLGVLEYENEQKMKLLEDIRESKEREIVATEDRIKLMAGDKDKIIATLESEIHTLKVYKQQQQSFQESFQRQIKSLQDELSHSRSDVAQLRSASAQKDEQIKQIKAQTETLIKRHRAKMEQDAGSKIDKYKARIEELNTIITDKTNDVRTEKERVNAFKEQIRDKVMGYKEQILTLQKSEITRNQEISTLKKQLEQQQRRIHELSQERQSYQAKSNALVEKIRELDRRADDEHTLKKHHEEQFTLLRREYEQLERKYQREVQYVDQQHEKEKLGLIRKVQQLEHEFNAEKERALIESNRSAALQVQLDKLVTQNRQLSLANATSSSSSNIGGYSFGPQRSSLRSSSIYEDTDSFNNDDANAFLSTHASRYRSPFKSIIHGMASDSTPTGKSNENIPPQPSTLKSSLRSAAGGGSAAEPIKMIEPVRFNRGRLAASRQK